MNERIKSLIERAEYQAQKHSGSDWQVHVEPSREQIFEKFAELIVAEMLQTCEDHPAWSGRMIGEKIKQHFGMNPNEITTAMLDRTINQCEQQLAENKND